MCRISKKGEINMDAFISYTHEDRTHAMDVVNFLESKNISCWIAPRDVVLSYASDIVDAISKCRYFIVVISEKTLASVHVLNEIEQAYKYYRDGNLAIIPLFIENVKLSPAMDYYLARIQHINGWEDFETAKIELLNKIGQANDFLSTASTTKPESKSLVDANGEEIRVANRYYDVDDKYEKRRLKTEGEFLLPYEKKVVDELLEDGEHLNGLVTCCMFARAVMEKINLNKFDKLIGFCYNEKAVFEANYDYRSEKTKFFLQDMEDENLEENLSRYMEEMGIDKFDFIDISMGFLDWKNPFKVIKTLKKYMNKDCRIYVKDIDDGALMFYPDDAKLFAKFKTFYALDPISGYRKSGRKIFSYFKKIHASSVELVHNGINVTGLDEEQKEKLFFAYFGFIPNDFKICYNEDPSRSDFKAVIDWCDENYDELEAAYMDDSTYYNSGYFIYKIRM